MIIPSLILNIYVKTNFSSSIYYALQGFYKEFILQQLPEAILWINEVGGTCKTAILIALKLQKCLLKWL